MSLKNCKRLNSGGELLVYLNCLWFKNLLLKYLKQYV
jgi:hypothetical protein